MLFGLNAHSNDFSPIAKPIKTSNLLLTILFYCGSNLKKVHLSMLCDQIP